MVERRAGWPAQGQSLALGQVSWMCLVRDVWNQSIEQTPTRAGSHPRLVVCLATFRTDRIEIEQVVRVLRDQPHQPSRVGRIQVRGVAIVNPDIPTQARTGALERPQER